MRKPYEDYPLDECAKQAWDAINKGFTIHQKFTCDYCGSRQTIGEANVFYTSGTCEECEGVTDIRKRGCNWLAIGTNL